MKNINLIVKKINIGDIEQNFDTILQRLYPARREAVQRLRVKKNACMSLAAGMLLQEIIWRECKIAPEELKLGKGEQGKPYIIGREDFQFNMSHSGNYVALVYGDCVMGVDIETIREKDSAVAKRCFTQEEYEYILNGFHNNSIKLHEGSNGTSKEVNRAEAESKIVFKDSNEGEMNAKLISDMDINRRFFRIWTMKESYLKCTGTGISVPLNSFYVNPATLMVEDTGYRFQIWDDEEYCMALCTEEEVRVRCDSM